jgi:hypothetical protein
LPTLFVCLSLACSGVVHGQVLSAWLGWEESNDKHHVCAEKLNDCSSQRRCWHHSVNCLQPVEGATALLFAQSRKQWEALAARYERSRTQRRARAKQAKISLQVNFHQQQVMITAASTPCSPTYSCLLPCSRNADDNGLKQTESITRVLPPEHYSAIHASFLAVLQRTTETIKKDNHQQLQSITSRAGRCKLQVNVHEHYVQHAPISHR